MWKQSDDQVKVQEVTVVQEVQKVVEDLENLMVQEDPSLRLMKQQQDYRLALSTKLLFNQLINKG